MIKGIAIAAVIGIAAGWATLAVGGHTDNSGRAGIAVGAAVFVVNAVAWRRGRRGWMQGLVGGAIIGGLLLAHFLTRIGHP